jgi:hypothetical protein
MSNVKPIQFYEGRMEENSRNRDYLPYVFTFLLIFLVLMIDVFFSPGTLIVLALSLLTPYFYYIPRSTLAAVLISAVAFMIDWKILNTLWKCNSK